MSDTVAAPARARLWQPRQPIFWLSLAMLLSGLVVAAGPLLASSPGWDGVGVGVLLLVVQGGVLGAVAWLLPQLRRQPRPLRIAAVVLGALVGTTSAMLLSGFLAVGTEGLVPTAMRAAVIAPVAEDIPKILVVLAILTLALQRRVTVMDGVVYGFLVGAGFEVWESVQYAISHSGDIGESIRIAALRTAVGFGLHAMWTGAGGAALAYCLGRRQRGQSGRWWVLPVVMLGPMLLHSAWDAMPLLGESLWVPVGLAAIVAVSVVGLVVAVRAGREDEWAWLTAWSSPGVERRGWRRLPRQRRRALVHAAEVRETLSAP